MTPQHDPHQPDAIPTPEETAMDHTTPDLDRPAADGTRPSDASTEGLAGRRRPLDTTSLVAGVVVLAIAAAFAFGDPDSIRDQGRVIGPLALLGLGAALLLGSLKR
jgi:hypothetical protein